MYWRSSERLLPPPGASDYNLVEILRFASSYSTYCRKKVFGGFLGAGIAGTVQFAGMRTVFF